MRFSESPFHPAAAKMDNPEEVLHSLDEFAKLKPKSIPRELEDYLMYVARTGDPVYQWPTVKILFREKLLNVITEFYETTPTLDVAQSPNVDPFNYETMKTVLLERLEAFSNAPFTVQRLCELLTTPRKEYNRPDKFMRAIEKNILVVSTRGPGGACRPDSALSEPIPNGVSEPSEAASNQSSSSNSAGSNEETNEESSNEASPKETEENHVIAESSIVMESNDVETEQAESSVTVSEETKEEEASESIVKESDESPEATDSSDSVTYGEVNSAGEATEAVNVTSTECVSNSEVKDIPEQPEICEAETSAVESVPLPSSSEVSSAGDEVVKADTAETQSETEKEDTVSDSKEAENVVCDTPAKEDEVSSEAAPEPSASSDSVPDVTESTESISPKEAASDAEPEVSSAQQDEGADSTASESAQVAEAPTSEVVSSNSSDDSSEATSDSKLNKDDQPDTVNVVADVAAELPKSSEAAPVVEKSESEVKESAESAKADVDANITSTEGAAGPEEAMDVDESSNQPSEASAGSSEAMEVAEEEEAMEVCEDSGLEPMTTSPEEVSYTVT